jgi:hypothetical protein
MAALRWMPLQELLALTPDPSLPPLSPSLLTFTRNRMFQEYFAALIARHRDANRNGRGNVNDRY